MRIADLLEETGAIRTGHFLLSSGKHSDFYVEKARMFERPRLVMRMAEEIAAWYDGVQAVLSPAVGALPLGFAVALAADARFLYAERVEGRLQLRRRFRLQPGERTLVVEDVVTTGGSAAEVAALVRAAGAHLLGVAAMVDRSEGDVALGLRALARVDARAFDPDACPLCREGSAAEAPGSRHR